MAPMAAVANVAPTSSRATTVAPSRQAEEIARVVRTGTPGGAMPPMTMADGRRRRRAA